MKRSQHDIKTFTDYRAFMKLYATDAKRANPQWSYGVWATQLDLKDTSSLTKILNGQRHPGLQMVEKLSTFFRFSQKEKNYFTDLVTLYKHQDNPRLCVALLEKMGKKYPNADITIIDTRAFEFFSLWYILPLREMVRLEAFREDTAWIAGQFKAKISPQEIRKGLDLLLSLGLLSRNSSGELDISHGRVSSTFDKKSEGLKLYHEAMLDRAKEALRAQDVLEREFLGCCMVIRPENVSRAKELIREFKDRFEELLEEDEGSQIYQLQIQFFGLTQEISSKEKS